MKILMIAQFNTFPFEGGNSRFTYLLDKIDYKKHTVEFITSSFRHGTKSKRVIDKSIISKLKYKLTLLDEPGYTKNVSLKRLHSHKKLAKNLKKYLYNLDYKPDIIYCSVPSLDVAKVAVKYANKNRIKFIIDIQDLWPEAFKMALNIPIISNIIFYPMKKKANYVYSHSDEIVAVSQTYVNRGLSVNKNVKKGLSVFLGTNLKYFDECAEKNRVRYDDKTIRIAYIGTLGTSYDIKSIIDAIRILNNKGINNIKLVVMGDGPLKESFELYAKQSEIDYEFTGRLDYEKMVGLLSSCDICVNPIVGSSVASIINKVGDYAAAGLPVINTQNSIEYKNLIDKYEAGYNCENGDPNDIANKLERLINDSKLREKKGKGNRKLAVEMFDREKTYPYIIDLFSSKKVSVIVPVYNTEKYLDKCINSILKQTYSNIELILLNDGSTDSSLDICNKYAKKDKRIVVVNKKNTGQSDTRNCGLEKATGDYISFVDSDDFIDNEMISTLVYNLEKYNVDVSVCSLKLFKDGEIINVNKKNDTVIIDTNHIYKQNSKDGFGASVCNKLYKKSVLANIRFGNTNIGEDGKFNEQVYNKTKKVVFQNSTYYHYYSRNDSTIHGKFKENEYKSLLLEEKKILNSKSKSEEKYRKSRLPVSASKVIVGIISTNIDNSDDMLINCFNMIKKNIKYTIFSFDISILKKGFTIFCLINKKRFFKKNKRIISLCKKLRLKIG